MGEKLLLPAIVFLVMAVIQNFQHEEVNSMFFFGISVAFICTGYIVIAIEKSKNQGGSNA